jgi:hypothetical protein
MLLTLLYQPLQSGSHRRNMDYAGMQSQILGETERYEMKLSEQLASELQRQLALNNALMSTLMQTAVIEPPAKPQMDEKKKVELLARLAEGKKRKADEEIARKKEMAKRMAKARKGKNG